MEGTVALFPEATRGSGREVTEARLVFPLPVPRVLQCRVSSMQCTSVAVFLWLLQGCCSVQV